MADVVPTWSGIILVVAALAVIGLLTTLSANRIIRRVEDLGEGYTELYKTQHREVMEALKGETQKALADTKALVMEHTELERILRVLAQRSTEEEEASHDGRSSGVEPDK